jgi:aminoglycoside 6'-N-acetyltransferase I
MKYEAVIEQLATMLNEAFPGQDGYPTLIEAREEVLESLTEGRISLVALDDNDEVLGWIGAIPTYRGHAYELHPLVVRADRRNQGIGSRLVADMEEQLRNLGTVTVYLGTDDVNNQTNIGGVDVYPTPLKHAIGLSSISNHPIAFYSKLGYKVVGILPDVNGFGKPDIFMAKRLREPLGK